MYRRSLIYSSMILIPCLGLGCASAPDSRKDALPPGAADNASTAITAEMLPDAAEIPPEYLALAEGGAPAQPVRTAANSGAAVPAQNPVSAADPPLTAPVAAPVAAPVSASVPVPGKKYSATQSAPNPQEGSSACEGELKDGILAYRIRRGDSLMKISFETLGDVRRWREILRDNKNQVPALASLKAGTVLSINCTDYVVVKRNGKSYLIKRRDTLIRIAKHLYGTPLKWRKIWENNRQLIHDPNLIYAGFHLYYKMNQQEKDFARSMEKRMELLTTPPLAQTPPVTPASRKPASVPKEK